MKLPLLAIACCLLLLGCATPYKIRIPSYALPPAVKVTQFVAGVGKSDLTPPPGIPMGGHGPAGRVARGYWTRIHARAFYFQDSNQHALALVTCELFLLPAGLRAKVLQIVNEDGQHRLDDADLIISATHTHHSPANYASAELYNSFAGPLPHFDEKLFIFLAQQIAKAITEAIDDAHRNRGVPHELFFYQDYAPGIQRNRAIAPFFKNDNGVTDPILTAAQSAGAACPDGSTLNCQRYLAVDPTLQVLKIVRSGSVIALLVFYAVHPTAMTHDSELYSSDLTGVAMQNLEADRGVIAGFFNGAEGDISPNWQFQDRDDVLILGGSLANRVREVIQKPAIRSSPDPQFAIVWSRVANNASCDRFQFAGTPLAGAAEPGGAEDGRTVLYNYGWREEARKSSPSGPHGVKEPSLDGPLEELFRNLDANGLATAARKIHPTHFLANPKVFPQQVPVARLHIEPLFSAVAIPVEATTAVGQAIRDHVIADGNHIDTVIGLANEYIGYTTTAKEYNLQQYEGASTLLGPQEADMLVCLLSHASLVPTSELAPAQEFAPGPPRKNEFGPQTMLVGHPRNMIDEDLEPLIPRRLRRLESRIPRFEWSESASYLWHVQGRRVSVFARPLGSTTWNELDNDDGINILTVLADAMSKDMHRYALWIPPDHVLADYEYYFRVHTPEGSDICSINFALDTATTIPVVPLAQEPCFRK